MGKLRTFAASVSAAFVPPGYITPQAIVSPWDDSRLDRFLVPDIFGADYCPVSRTTAMKLPGVARARNLMVSTISRFPMYQYLENVQAPVQPEWLQGTDGGSPVFRLAYTVDDLIFHGWSVWSRQNNTDGTIARADRMDRSTYQLDEVGRCWLLNENRYARADEVILIPGLHEGILAYGDEVISDTKSLYRAVRQRLNSPVPPIDLHQENDAPMTPDEIDTLVNRWVKARQNPNGAVGYSNNGIKVNTLDTGDDGQLMIEARNAASLDLARLVGITGSRIDATTAKASLNYETTTGRNQEFVDFDLALYMTPITARLSMDDVTPKGTRIAFDLADFTALTPSPAGPGTTD